MTLHGLLLQAGDPGTGAGPIDNTVGAFRERASGIGDVVSAADILLVIVVLVLTYAVIRLTALIAGALAARYTRRRFALMQVLPIVRITLWMLAIYIIVLGIFDPSRESLIAFAATAGIGIGFAAQDVLKNIFGGVLIIMDRPFQVGDLVDIGDVHGEVIGIGLRATRVRTPDDAVVSVPNAEVVNQPVSNANSGALDCMVVTELYLPALVDTTLVTRLCREAAATSPYVYLAKPVTVRLVDEFRETFLTKVRIKAYVYDHRLEAAFRTDVAERAKRAFREASLLPEPPSFGVDEDEQQKYFHAGEPEERRNPVA
ncbi:MAG: mechanosensitive ion channel family protein [Gemmatimonadaceae bacterium]